jgi:polysaccharide pyruvyl transferase WcaK-like protein
MPLRVARRVKAEIGHSLRIWRWLRRARAVIVCGGGQLDEFWGGPWGHPLTLAIWAALARRRGVPFIVVSVGAGQVKAGAARWLLARALDSAKHVSVRDPRSARLTRTLMHAPFTETRDIAFLLGRKMSLDVPQAPAERISVAFSPMSFARAGIWPRADEKTYTAYFNAMRDCCAEWLSRGWAVTLYSTATMDRATLLDLQAALQQKMPAQAGSIRVLPQGTVGDLIGALRQHQLCVAARLHGVIISQLAVVPTVAIVHDWKVEEQMTMAGHGEFALDIHGVTAEQILRACDALVARSSQVASGLSTFARNSLQTVLDDLKTLQPFLTRPGA